MVRRRSARSLPWLHRFSRPIIGAIAITGAILTAYLTVTKLTGGEVACGIGEAAKFASGCKDVLNSPYATVFGLPLSLFGSLAYLSMATFALSPLFVNPETNKVLRKQLENWTWLLLLAGATAMAVFSGYLMYVLTTDLKAVCYYCIGSATFAISLLVLTVLGRDWEEIGQLFFIPIVVATVTLVATLAIYANINAPDVAGRTPIPEPSVTPQPPYGWEVTTTSGAAELALAKHLTAVGAKMYGAFWCPHCYEQKQLFGKEAAKEITYIECAPEGENSQPQACTAAGVQSFPTWVINGKTYRGTQSLEKLVKASEYKGKNNFKYLKPGI